MTYVTNALLAPSLEGLKARHRGLDEKCHRGKHTGDGHALAGAIGPTIAR